MSTLLSDVVDRMLKLQPVAGDARSENITQKQANIRAASVREGFQSMRARSDGMAERLQHYRRKQAVLLGKTDSEASADDASSQIILRSKN